MRTHQFGAHHGQQHAQSWPWESLGRGVERGGFCVVAFYCRKYICQGKYVFVYLCFSKMAYASCGAPGLIVDA